jgi:hypothetical protein
MAISCNQAKVTNQDHFVKHWLDQITRFSELDNTSVVKGIILHRWLGAAAAGIKHDNLQTVHFGFITSWNQCCGSGSRLDPDSTGSLDPDTDRQNGPQKRKKLINFMF